jgi:hypothetical protein
MHTFKKLWLQTFLLAVIAVTTGIWLVADLADNNDALINATGEWQKPIYDIFCLITAVSFIPVEIALIASHRASALVCAQTKGLSPISKENQRIMWWWLRAFWWGLLPAAAISTIGGLMILDIAFHDNPEYEFYAPDTGLDWTYALAHYLSCFFLIFGVLSAVATFVFGLTGLARPPRPS